MEFDFRFQLIGPQKSGKTALLTRIRDGIATEDPGAMLRTKSGKPRLSEPVLYETEREDSGEKVNIGLFDSKSGLDFGNEDHHVVRALFKLESRAVSAETIYVR